jgi:hypothetical protein
MAHFDDQAQRAAEFRAFDSDHWLHATISRLVLTLASAEEIEGQSAVYDGFGLAQSPILTPYLNGTHTQIS